MMRNNGQEKNREFRPHWGLMGMAVMAMLGIALMLPSAAANEINYALVRGDLLTTQPRTWSDPQRTDLETLRPGDRLVFEELQLSVLSLIKPDPRERGSVSLNIRSGGSASVTTLAENSNQTFWFGGREGWQINVYTISDLNQTVRVRAQRTMRPLSLREEPPVPPKIDAMRRAREAGLAPGAAPAAPAPAGREGAWSARRVLNVGGELTAPGLRVRLVRVDGSSERGARRWATFIVNTNTTSREVRLEEWRATFVEDYQISANSITVRNRPGEGRVVVTVNYLP